MEKAKRPTNQTGVKWRRWWWRRGRRKGGELHQRGNKRRRGGPCPLVLLEAHQRAWKSERVIHYHLLCLAEVDVFHILTPWLAFLDVHDADKWHGPTSEEEDGEEHNDDGGGADQLPLLNGLQAQMEAEGIGDGTTQTCQRTAKKWQNQAVSLWNYPLVQILAACWRGDCVPSPLNHMMNIILGVILWSLKKFSRKDRGKMFTARPRRTRTYGQREMWPGTTGFKIRLALKREGVPTMHQMTKEISNLWGKLKMDRPRKANTHVSGN